MSQEQLAGFLHDIARILPENRRLEFLTKLNSVNGRTTAGKNVPKAEKMDVSELLVNLKQVKQDLTSIENGELCLIGSLNEEYDDWYDSEDDEPLYIADLDKEELITYSIRRLVLDAMYAAYQANPAEKRPEALYNIICNSGCVDITLENMLQEGKEELEQQEDFLDDWICFLGEHTGREAERLMKEAVTLNNNFAKSLEYARRFSAYHPGIYESRDSSKYRESMKEIYRSKFQKTKKEKSEYYRAGELCENRMDSQSYYMTAFFDGEFQHVIKEGMNAKKALLLYLYHGEKLSQGCRKMCENIVNSMGFTAEEYSKGLDSPFELNDVDTFWNLFGRWKNGHVISGTDQEAIIDKLDRWIQMRVEGIMENNRRNYYGECAAFVAAFGEVRESRGERNAKDNEFEAYRSKYSRRTG